MSSRLLGLLPMLVAALAIGAATDAWSLAATLGALATALALVGQRWELDRGRQIVTSAMGAGAGYAAAAGLYEARAGVLAEGWARLAAAALIAGAARFLIIAPKGGRAVTTACTFAALVATGETRGKSFGVFAVLFLLTSLWALRADEHRLAPPRTSARQRAVAVAMLLLAAGLGLGATVGLRRAHAWLKSRGRSTAFHWQPRVGFSDKLDLGALDGLLDSETVVLRVHGPHVDYLRGVALDSYSGGRWLRSSQAEVDAKEMYHGDIAPGDLVQIAAVSERTGRFFLPLDARTVVTTPPDVLVDGMGSIKPASKHGMLVARFVRGTRDRAIAPPPRPADLELPRRLRPLLEKLAAEWTAGAGTPNEKLEAIERHLLTEFRYARIFQRTQAVDPALDFLLTNRRGHCEYFATALTLLARAVRVPARMVTGYRVGEHSPFGYYVVRERNAHAWAEVWTAEAGWTTRDATPEAALPQNSAHDASYAGSALDALRVGYDDLTDWLGRLTLRQTAVVWIFGFWVLVWIVGRGARRRRRAPPLPDGEAPLPFLDRFLAALARAGYSRRDDEPLERLAARIPDGEAARLLDRYAALRYGSIGDPIALAQDFDAYAKLRAAR